MVVTDRNGLPLTVQLESAGESEVKLALSTVDSIAVETKPLQVRKRPDILVADRGYDAGWLRRALHERNIRPKIPKRKKKGQKDEPKYNEAIKPYYRTRWIVERTFAWLGWKRRLLTRWERSDKVYQGFFTLACIMICIGRVLQ